ncbi:MAG TPA: hypothetical protein PLA43_19490 [Bryobacteraceae bacterium]|nr:hypothetical protein [Bryobacteraceae bacterium]HOQ47769.1 hypothetical protein [Bryobacteraceae bacterium]HPQ16240.1 hypothetical protein [Bryobacteraceae bacterium]HPU74144.1 hypothetical protein [Bryobacteraceae bacterium]
MKKYAWISVIACSLVASGCPSVSGRPKAAVYPNTRTLEAPCNVAWPEVLEMAGDAGFRLVAKDDDGYIARFLYLEPQLPEVVLGVTDADNLALANDGSGQPSQRLRIQSAVLALSPQNGGCEVKMSVSYQGQNGMWGRNWSSLESSGLLEYRLLSGLEVTKPAVGTRRAARGGSRRKPAKTEVSFAPLIIGGETERQ